MMYRETPGAELKGRVEGLGGTGREFSHVSCLDRMKKAAEVIIVNPFMPGDLHDNHCHLDL